MFFLILLYVDHVRNDFKNVNLVGYWKTKKEAEDFLSSQWTTIHEHWCNSAIIEYHDVGYIHAQKEREYFFTEDIFKKPLLTKMPIFLKNINSFL